MFHKLHGKIKDKLMLGTHSIQFNVSLDPYREKRLDAFCLDYWPHPVSYDVTPQCVCTCCTTDRQVTSTTSPASAPEFTQRSNIYLHETIVWLQQLHPFICRWLTVRLFALLSSPLVCWIWTDGTFTETQNDLLQLNSAPLYIIW